MTSQPSSVAGTFTLVCVGLVMGSFLETPVLHLPGRRSVLFARSVCGIGGRGLALLIFGAFLSLGTLIVLLYEPIVS